MDSVTLHQGEVAEQAGLLVAWFRETAKHHHETQNVVALDVVDHFVVALSGGVDSAVAAKAAALAAEESADTTKSLRVTLATGAGPSVATQELQDAQSIAARIGLPHRIIETTEIADPAYQINDARRCYHCKTHLFSILKKQFADAILVTGTNADDLQDYRPGLQAAAEHRVRAPLAELGFTKAIVRKLAEHWNLPIADKPASPCLASRIAYGLEVTRERLQMVEQAETWLRDNGLVEFRVRLHPGELARIEVPIHQLELLAAEPMRSQLCDRMKSFGFRFVTLDLTGFNSGSLNQLIQIT